MNAAHRPVALNRDGECALCALYSQTCIDCLTLICGSTGYSNMSRSTSSTRSTRASGAASNGCNVEFLKQKIVSVALSALMNVLTTWKPALKSP